MEYIVNGKDSKGNNIPYVIWEDVVENARKIDTIIVGLGYIAYCYINNDFQGLYTQGKTEIKFKKEARTDDEVKFICANNSVRIKVLFGQGHIPYVDKEFKISTEYGAHGEIEFSITDAFEIYKRISKKNITEDDVKECVNNIFLTEIFSCLSDKIKTKGYKDINAEISNINAQIKEKLNNNKEISNLIYIESVNVEGFQFSDEFKKAYGNALEEKKKKIAEDEKNLLEQEKTQRDVDNAKDLISSVPGRFKGCGIEIDNNRQNSNNSNTQNNQKPQKNDKKDEKYCINCGVQLPKNARFCSNCGTKLD